MSRQKKIKFGEIPLDYVLLHRREAEDFCDEQTNVFCYCGKFATGFHTSSCRQYRAHFQRYIENIYNNKNKEVTK